MQALHGCPALPASYLHLHLRRLHSAQAQCHTACASWRHSCRLLCPSSKLRQQKIRHKEGELGHSKRQANGQLPDDLHVDVPSRREGGLLPRSGNAEKSSGPSGPPSPPHSGMSPKERDCSEPGPAASARWRSLRRPSQGQAALSSSQAVAALCERDRVPSA